jgi:hypothetical protein
MTINVGKLVGKNAVPKDVHPNEYFHDIYFESVEEVLKNAHKGIDSFDIITDRNNIRKIDAAITKDKENYPNFYILFRKYGNVVVLKREEAEFNGSTIG